MVHERSRRSGGGEWWTLPGGGLRPGESAEEAVRREVFEETGLVVSDARYVLEMPYPSGMTSVFSVTVADGEPRVGRDDGFGPEQLGIDWLPVPELPIETAGVPVPPLMVVLPAMPGQAPPEGDPAGQPLPTQRSGQTSSNPDPRASESPSVADTGTAPGQERGGRGRDGRNQSAQAGVAESASATVSTSGVTTGISARATTPGISARGTDDGWKGSAIARRRSTTK